MSERNVLWRALAWPGIEHLRLTTTERGSVADGLIIAAADGGPFRLHYRVEVDHEWRFRQLRVLDLFSSTEAPGGRLRELSLDAGGAWTHEGFDGVPDLSGCLEIDITATPFTNTLPIRRLDLAQGDSAEIAVAWIHVPEMRIERADQRYTLLERTSNGARYRYQSLGSGFTADLDVDEDGLVIDYPGIWERSGSA